MSNKEIANIFYTIADILEIKDENFFRIRAYRRAAQNIENLTQNIAELIQGTQKIKIPGIGVDLESKDIDLSDDFFNEKHQADFEKIKNYIVKQKLYLNPLLSMESTALELGMSKSYFSKLINSYSDYNFSDFINSLRVKQAKKFLSDDEFSEYTIVAIGLECGFNSKSTFYSAFKKFTSKTPSAYRSQH